MHDEIPDAGDLIAFCNLKHLQQEKKTANLYITVAVLLFVEHDVYFREIVYLKSNGKIYCKESYEQYEYSTYCRIIQKVSR